MNVSMYPYIIISIRGSLHVCTASVVGAAAAASAFVLLMSLLRFFSFLLCSLLITITAGMCWRSWFSL